MIISSRTPEGMPNRCPVCASEVVVEPSLFFGDAPCPSCGTLLWFLHFSDQARFYEPEEAASVRKRVIEFLCGQLGVSEADLLRDQTQLNNLELDSLDIVELIMELEETG